jgi:branched-chain amino acid transport system permease protein
MSSLRVKNLLVPTIIGIYSLLLLLSGLDSGFEGVFRFAILGLVTGSAYAIASSGLVITYATSNVFNMAHGAIGMVMAFMYWELSSNRGLPVWLSLVLVVLVIAPAFGAFLERVLMRRLTTATLTASLTVTVGLFVLLIGVARTIWPPAGRAVDEFFPGNQIQIAGVGVTWHEIITFLTGAAVAGGLYLLLNRTRTGIAMRAIVDNRELLALHGARPQYLGMLSWGIGSSLAAIAGILLVPVLQLDYFTLTLVVINAYAAAMVGRLKSLPRTFAGAIALGLLLEHSRLFFSLLPEGFQGDQAELLKGLRSALPTLFLFATMLILPQEKLRVGVIEGASLAKLPSRQKTTAWGIGLVAAVAVVVQFLGASDTASLGAGLGFGMIMLSLVVLTGYGGDVSLSQMSFVGVGALVVLKFGQVTPWAVLAAGLVAAAAGVIVAFPALRLRGLYIGLGTLAMAVALDELLFKSRGGFGTGGIDVVTRPPGFESEGMMAILMAVGFAVMAYLVLSIRRGKFGRLLLATRDSAAACGTLGLSITRTRVQVFALSAGLAGMAGAMFTGMVVAVGSATFEMFRSLPLLLLAAIGGITSITGVFLGGMFLGAGPALQSAIPAIEGGAGPGGLLLRLIQDDFVVTGLLALFATNPNGIARFVFKLNPMAKLQPEPLPESTLVFEDDFEEVDALAVS